MLHVRCPAVAASLLEHEERHAVHGGDLVIPRVPGIEGGHLGGEALQHGNDTINLLHIVYGKLADGDPFVGNEIDITFGLQPAQRFSEGGSAYPEAFANLVFNKALAGIQFSVGDRIPNDLVGFFSLGSHWF